MNFSVHADPVASAHACADSLLEFLAHEAQSKDRVTLAVSGGSTPKLMFERMAAAKFPWEKLHLFWVDERCVPPTDEQSNFHLANTYWLEPAGFPKRNVHRVHGELDPDEAARRYRVELTEFFHVKRNSGMPVFDAIHCGMGDDAHTASLFPGDALTEDRHGIAAAVHAPKKPHWRVTLLPGVLLAARLIAMLVTGADKAAPLKRARDSAFEPFDLPVQLILKQAPQAVWYLDQAAAAQVRA